MSKIEVNQIDTLSGSSTLLVGPSAATKLTFSSTLTVDFNVNSPGVTLSADMKMTPAFHAYLGSTQSVGDATTTKVQIDTEILDTDGCYDNTTNYRFTPTVAGKYFVYACLNHHGTSGNNVQYGGTYIYKNGGSYASVRNNANGSYPEEAMNVFVSAIVDMNGSTDYLELYTQTNTSSGSNGQLLFDNITKSCYFGAYRIIGA